MTRKPSRPPTPSILAALLALLALVAAGCQGSDPEPPAATLDEPTTEPEPPPDLTPSDSPTPTPTLDPTLYAIPDNPEDLNAEYFERVLQALYDVEGEAGRIIVEEEKVSEAALERLRAVYDGRRLDELIDLYDQQVTAGLDNTLRPPGNLHVTVLRVISADHECAFVAGLRDYSEIVRSPRDRSGEEDFFQLLQIEEGQDPKRRNPTPWVIGGTAIRSDGNQPEDPCTL